jgi:hypothetical protein
VVIGFPGLWGVVPRGVVGQLRHQAVLGVARFRAVLGATGVTTCCRDGCGSEICDPDGVVRVDAGVGAVAGAHQDVDGAHGVAVTSCSDKLSDSELLYVQTKRPG